MEKPVEPLRLRGIDHVLLLVTDLEKAVAFYERVAGCSVETRLPEFGMVELRAGSSHLDLVDISAAPGAWAQPEIAGGRNVDHIALAVESHDATALRAHLQAHNVEIGEERVEHDRTSFYVRDPSGNGIELQSAPQSRRA
jgi:catechol 2,3-dioxygenase-like lactoylglutathione lyase family enzyme